MEFISIPRAVSVRRLEAWDKRHDEGLFRVARLHLACNKVFDSKPETHLGERIEVSVAQNAQIKVIQTIKTSISVVDLTETIREELFSQQVGQEVLSKVEASAGAPTIPIKTGVSFQGRLSQSISESLKQSSRTSVAITRTEERILEVERIRDQVQNPGEYVTALPYERRHVDICAVWVDWLTVAYRKTALGLRYKRVKSPALPPDRNPRDNECSIGAPILRLSYWHLLPTKSYEVSAKEYKLGVSNPAEVKKEVLEDGAGNRPRREDFKRVPTLYQLSNHAFPLKYFPQDREWTEEELLSIQEREPKDSAWWFNCPKLR